MKRKVTETQIQEAGEKARDAARKALENAAPVELKVWESAQHATWEATTFLNMVGAQIKSMGNSSNEAHRKDKWTIAEKLAKSALEDALKAERDAKEKLTVAAGEAFTAWEKMDNAYDNALQAY